MIDGIRTIFRLLNRNMPIKADCGHWARNKNLYGLRHRAAGYRKVCPDCYARETAWNKRTPGVHCGEVQ